MQIESDTNGRIAKYGRTDGRTDAWLGFLQNLFLKSYPRLFNRVKREYGTK